MARKPQDKKLYCPKILKMADTCANQIYEGFATDHFEEMVQVNQEKLRKLYAKLKRKKYLFESNRL
jgi:hypothetical protein